MMQQTELTPLLLEPACPLTAALGTAGELCVSESVSVWMHFKVAPTFPADCINYASLYCRENYNSSSPRVSDSLKTCGQRLSARQAGASLPCVWRMEIFYRDVYKGLFPLSYVHLASCNVTSDAARLPLAEGFCGSGLRRPAGFPDGKRFCCISPIRGQRSRSCREN